MQDPTLTSLSFSGYYFLAVEMELNMVCIIQIVLMRMRTFQGKPPHWIGLMTKKINMYIFRNKDDDATPTKIPQNTEEHVLVCFCFDGISLFRHFVKHCLVLIENIRL